MRTLIRGGRLLDPAMKTDTEADLLIEDGVIIDSGPGPDAGALTAPASSPSSRREAAPRRAGERLADSAATQMISWALLVGSTTTGLSSVGLFWVSVPVKCRAQAGEWTASIEG